MVISTALPGPNITDVIADPVSALTAAQISSDTSMFADFAGASKASIIGESGVNTALFKYAISAADKCVSGPIGGNGPRADADGACSDYQHGKQKGARITFQSGTLRYRRAHRLDSPK
jgi:hypothetical protein